MTFSDVCLVKDVGKYRANRIVFDSDSDDDDEETVDVTQSMKHELKDKPVVYTTTRFTIGVIVKSQ